MVLPVVLWGDFRRLRPDLAEAGRRLLYQFGVGLGFLGTVRGDGGPRIHPICPLLTDDGLYAFLAPSLKRDDLRRDPRYALHSFRSAATESSAPRSGARRAGPPRSRGPTGPAMSATSSVVLHPPQT